MRRTESARVRRRREGLLHLGRGKPTTYERRWLDRQYDRYMQHEGGTDGASPEQVKFAKVWLKGVLDDFAKPPGKLSLSAVARKAGVHRNNITDWQNLRAFPQAKTLKRFCDNLNLDYSVPARILGWAEPAPSESAGELDVMRVRAEAMMRNFKRRGRLTPERKAKYEAIIRSAERSYTANMEAFFEEAERDFADDHTTREDEARG